MVADDKGGNIPDSYDMSSEENIGRKTGNETALVSDMVGEECISESGQQIHALNSTNLRKKHELEASARIAMKQVFGWVSDGKEDAAALDVPLLCCPDTHADSQQPLIVTLNQNCKTYDERNFSVQQVHTARL